MRKRVRKISEKKVFDKYDLYLRSVQSADTDAEFLRDVYRELRKRDGYVLREDFAGTFALCCEWAKLGPKYLAMAIDRDPEPLKYGEEHNWSRLKEPIRKRVQWFERDVLKPAVAPADIVVAMNFSYFIFQERALMKKYFQTVLKSLKKDGIFVVDIFGGSLCQDANEENTKYRGFTYYWDQESFDPVSNRAVFHIHFKIKGQKKTKNVFTYDWRMWSIPEIREIMEEAGFSRTHVYWEGTTRSGSGNGEFVRAEKGEACQAWIAYIVAEK